MNEWYYDLLVINSQSYAISAFRSANQIERGRCGYSQARGVMAELDRLLHAGAASVGRGSVGAHPRLACASPSSQETEVPAGQRGAGLDPYPSAIVEVLLLVHAAYVRLVAPGEPNPHHQSQRA